MIKLLLTIGRILVGLLIFAIGVKMIPLYAFISHTSVESIMYDVTETSIAKPDSTTLLEQFNLDKNKYDGATFRFTDLNDVSQNAIHQVILSKTLMILSNELDRDKEIKQFKDSVGSILSQSQNEVVGRNRSSIYIPIAKELTALSQSKVDSKSLVVYSDLLENTDDISLYGKSGKDLLNNHTDELIQKFNTLYALPNLAGITIYLIYQPDTIYNDEAYKKISAVYKTMLTAKGATVTIEANLLKTQ